MTLDNGQDTLLLDWGGLRETVAIDTSKDLFLQSHMIKQINFFSPIRLQVLAFCNNTIKMVRRIVQKTMMK